MRKFKALIVFALVAGFAVMAFAEGIPTKITIKDCAKKKPPVVFPHKAHFEVTKCETCHHTFKGLTAENYADMKVAACSTCHVTPEKETTPVCGNMSSKTNPYHILCKGCHKKMRAKNAESKAPTKCKACHVKPAAKS